MAALLDERSRRQQEKTLKNRDSTTTRRSEAEPQQPNLQSLVESVKRKSAVLEEPSLGKRRKLS